MIESGFGRTERAEVGQGRVQPRPPAEAGDGDVRQPATELALVHAQLLQAEHEPSGEDVGVPRLLLGQDDHRHSLRLAVVVRPEHRPAGVPGHVPQDAGDGADLFGRAAPEKRHRKVEVVGREDAHVLRPGDLLPLPGGKTLDRCFRESEGAEEPEALMAPNASGLSHTNLCRTVPEVAARDAEL